MKEFLKNIRKLNEFMRDLSLHLMDLLQNSISARATFIEIGLYAKDDGNELVMELLDNGCGMNEEFLKKVTDPFSTTRTTRKVGLGIPLTKASSERSGGRFSISSQPGQGTKLLATYRIDHIDRLPLGNLAETLTTTIMAEPEIRYKLTLKHNENIFKFDTCTIKETLAGVPIVEMAVIQWMNEYIDEGVRNIFGGVLNEVLG